MPHKGKSAHKCKKQNLIQNSTESMESTEQEVGKCQGTTPMEDGGRIKRFACYPKKLGSIPEGYTKFCKDFKNSDNTKFVYYNILMTVWLYGLQEEETRGKEISYKSTEIFQSKKGLNEDYNCNRRKQILRMIRM